MNREQGQVLGEVPDESSELLPWFLNGSLAPEEAAGVAQRLQRSPELRREAELMEVIAESVREHQVAAWQPSARHFDTLMSRIDAQSPPPRRALARALDALRQFVRDLDPGTAWVVGAQACAIAVLAFMLVSGESPPADSAAYRTLTSAPTDVTAPVAGVTVKVIFSPDATVADILAALESVNGSISSGPTAVGVFTVAIPEDADLDAVRVTLSDSAATVLVQTQRIEGAK